MTAYVISSQQTTIGTYEAESAREALDAMARDAGYADHDASCEVVGSDPDDWTASPAEFRGGTVALLVEEADDESEIKKIAAAHLAGIEGGLKGAVTDFRHGAGIDVAAGLDDSWQLPDGMSIVAVKAEVRRQLRAAVEEAEESDAREVADREREIADGADADKAHAERRAMGDPAFEE